MKYLSLNSVASAYDGCYKKTTNQFWSLIAILKVINKRIEPATSYTFISRDVSEILDNLFTFGKRNNYDSITWSILFSNIWKEYMLSNFIRNSPNIYDVAIWLYRKERFGDDINSLKLLSDFLNTIHLNKEDILPYFEFDEKEIIFEDNPYDDESLIEELSANHEVVFQFEELNEQGTVIQFEKKTLIFEDKKCIQYAAGNFGQAYVQTLYSAQKVQQCIILTKFDFNSLYKKQINSSSTMDTKQVIIYGAPGTGKSHKVKGDEKVKRADEKNLVFRTTFHPDSDYSTFVGAYKPTMKTVADKYKAVVGKDEEIAYEFIPQAFLQAYIAAWNHQEENVFLVIEEINRGNCAQIFGDLFQLLDRDDYGFSEYPIKADRDLAKFLGGKDEKGNDVLVDKDGIKDGKLKLPKNLYILATMNTSDQSLFPIDSAFKRRWDWVYTPIAQGKDENGNLMNWQIEGQGENSWWIFIRGINEVIDVTTHSEDKKLGFFFCKAQNNEVKKETFVNKVVFYLWNDVFKVYGFKSDIFDNKDKTEKIKFKSFYNDDGSVNEETMSVFVKNVMAKAPKENTDSRNLGENEEQSGDGEAQA